jgi:hypothetical protein
MGFVRQSLRPSLHRAYDLEAILPAWTSFRRPSDEVVGDPAIIGIQGIAAVVINYYGNSSSPRQLPTGARKPRKYRGCSAPMGDLEAGSASGNPDFAATLLLVAGCARNSSGARSRKINVLRRIG